MASCLGPTFFHVLLKALDKYYDDLLKLTMFDTLQSYEKLFDTDFLVNSSLHKI